MTTANAAEPTPVSAEQLRPQDLALRAARENTGLVAIVAGQAVWFWWAISRGWYLQAELSNLADGMGRRLNWSYLSEPLGGHFGPVGRLLYWLFDQVGPLDYTATIAFRVACQALSTVLLYGVLVTLVGRSRLVIGILAVYAFNPLLLAGTAWLTSGAGLALGQVLGLIVIRAHLRYEQTHTLRDAAITGLLLGVLMFSVDQFVVIALVLPLLSVLHFYRGGVRDRLFEVGRRWRDWLLIYLPLGAAIAAALVFADSSGSAPLSLHGAYSLVRESWLKSFAPALVGGPWRWYAGVDNYISYSLPPYWMVLLAELGVLVTVLVGVRRLGLRSLLAWVMPVITGIVGVLLVGYGRYATYGNLLAITPRYQFEIVALFAIGAALALAGPIEARDADPQPEPAPRGPRPRARAGRLRPDALPAAVGSLAVVAIVLASLVSGARFTTQLSRSPVHDYVQNLEASARTLGSQVNIYDTAVPPAVISNYESSHRVSDVLRLAQVPARFDDPSSEPLVVSADGHLTKAVFVANATGTASGTPGCTNFLHGTGTWTIPLSASAPAAEWFLRLELYQSAASTISVEVLNRAGRALTPIGGETVHLRTIEALNLPLTLFAPSAVRIHSTQASLNLCLTRVAIGAPFATGSA